MDSEVSFGLWLKRRRKALDLTQDSLAQRVGCSLATIQKIESDERRPSRQIAELLQELVNPLGVGVVIRATHLCMSMRGAMKAEAQMRTTYLTGAFLTHPETRAEFLNSVEGRRRA